MKIFGWSMPPGVSHRDIDAAMSCGTCEICGGDVDNDACVCHECEVCGGLGEARCLVEHGYVLDAEQITSGWRYVGAAAQAAEADRAAADAFAADLEADRHRNVQW